jgi:hypothetical protein
MEGASPTHPPIPCPGGSPRTFLVSPPIRDNLLSAGIEYINTDVINLTLLIGKSRGRAGMSLHSPSFPLHVGICRVPSEPANGNFFLPDRKAYIIG